MKLDKPQNSESKVDKKTKNNQDMFDDISSLAWKLWEIYNKKWNYKIENETIKFEKYIYTNGNIWYTFNYKENNKEKTIQYVGIMKPWYNIKFRLIVAQNHMSINIDPKLHNFLYESLSKILLENTVMNIIKKTWTKSEMEKLKKEFE